VLDSFGVFLYGDCPPVGESQLVTYGGLPSDYYLWLVGIGGRLLRGTIPITDAPPQRTGQSVAQSSQ